MASITKRGSKSHHVRIRRSGYPTLSGTFDTRADAERWARDREREMDRGTLPDTLEARRTTLADALTDYRLKVTPKHKGAVQEASRILTITMRRIAALPLADLTTAAIEDFIDDRMEGDGVSGSTVNRELGIMTQALKRARKRGWMVHNPMSDVDRPPNAPGRERRLDPSERKRFTKALAKARNKLFKGFVIIASESGMRRGELLKIEWKQVNFPSRKIQLRAPQTKNGSGREVPLTREAVKTLRWIRRKTGDRSLVFHGLTPEAIKKCWQRTCARAGVEDFHLHDLRHERVSSLIDEGWNIIQAMAVSGHKDMRAFRRYAHPKIEILVSKLDELDPR